jgi:threonine/homoserine/homoserine lactone efflux protein
MSFEVWLAFAAASAVLLTIPGPTVLLVIAYAVGHGRRAAAATVAGTVLGDLVAISASMLGLGVLLAASATLFTVLKWVGAAYLVYLGIRLWRAPVAADAANGTAPAVSGQRMLLHSFWVTVLNPKGIVFFVAFLPQFLNPAAPLLPQMLILAATFLVLAALNASAYAFAAAAARGAIRRPAVQRAVNRTGGTLLIGAGLLAAAWRRAAS